MNKITSILQQQGHQIKIAYNLQNTLSGILLKAKAQIKLLRKSGVNKLTCSKCNSVYVGQAGQNFKPQNIKHCRYFRVNQFHSAIVKHCLEAGHRFLEIKRVESVTHL